MTMCQVREEVGPRKNRQYLSLGFLETALETGIQVDVSFGECTLQVKPVQ